MAINPNLPPKEEIYAEVGQRLADKFASGEYHMPDMPVVETAAIATEGDQNAS